MSNTEWAKEFEGTLKGGVGHFKIFHIGPSSYEVIDLTLTDDDPVVRHCSDISSCYREAQALWDAYRETLRYCLETEFPGETFTKFAVMTWCPIYLIEDWNHQFNMLEAEGHITVVEQRPLGTVYDYNV